ncbi:5-oxoprolinase subunit B family protein [Reyranella sp.]|uniref:5-oxoprolinase subunit B family protein n=1 Tax=Reyranella sp. TaxID=1929291 RepID=UPI003BA92D13
MNSGVIELSSPRVSLCGSAALLLDAEGPLSLPTQERIWRLGDIVLEWDGVVDVQAGMNSLLVVLDPLNADPAELSTRMLDLWPTIEAGRIAGRLLEVGVVYGGEGGQDLPDVAAYHRATPEAIVALHAAPEYVVFAPSVSPGFGYLFGLDPRLFTPRRKVPVMRPVGGGVSIGGAQSNLGKPYTPGGPTMNPTGWHTIGRAPEVPVPFDLANDPPNLLSLGDRIRFRIDRIEA